MSSPGFDGRNYYYTPQSSSGNYAPGDMSTSALTMDKVPGDYAVGPARMPPVPGGGLFKSKPEFGSLTPEQMSQLIEGAGGLETLYKSMDSWRQRRADRNSSAGPVGGIGASNPEMSAKNIERAKAMGWNFDASRLGPESVYAPGGYATTGQEYITYPEARWEQGGDITVPSNPSSTTPGGGGGAQITQGTGATIDPSQSTLSPNFAPYVYDMLRSAQTAASRPFMPYMGQRFAGSSPLEQQAFRGLGNLQTPWQFGAGSGMAYQAGLGSFTQPNTAEAFMSPYMRNVTDIAKREARRQSDIGALGDRAAFAKAGAFGGSRQAIVEAERQRNLAQQMGDIEERGLQSAYDRATQQYNAERDAQLRSAMGLGTLGQQQFGSQMQGLQGLLSAGGTQRQIAQQPLDFGYQQWQESLQYPYKQATFLSSMLAGMPVGAAPYRPATDSDSGFASALQGGLSGLALYNLFNQK